jgi:calcineurin-like phosphoesterase family protein
MKTFLIADTHFGHANILNFERNDGTKLRPEFKDIKEHDEYLAYRWNSVVSPEDKVYHLGDIGFTSFTHTSNIFSKLNGTKVLIKGNHDNFKLSQYAQVFKDVRAYHILDKFILSHIPIHPESLSRWKANIHGHLHDNLVGDPRYYNVSVERLIDYTPIDFEEIKSYYESM